MDDLISRQAALDICRAPHMRNADCSDFEMAIMMLPPAQPKRIKGRWISADAIFGGVPFYCSECGENTRDTTVMGKPRWNFCPNCGAEMEVNRDE